MHRNRWLLLVVALVAVLTLGAAGCGGDDDDAAADDTGATDTGDAGGGAGAPDRLGRRAAVARPGQGHGHDVVERHPGPDGPAREAESRHARARAARWRRAGRSTGNVVTFHLREDATWTNGDPVTAQDFVYSWKRTLSPELAADYAYQLYGVKGAAEYNGCAKNCDALADKVGVTAVDDYTLQVELTSEQPWFLRAGLAPLVPAGSPGDGRGVRRQLDGSREHRHQRPLHARVVGSRGLDQHGQEPRLPRRRTTSRSSASTARSSSTGSPACRPSRPARSTRSTAAGSRPRRSTG